MIDGGGNDVFVYPPVQTDGFRELRDHQRVECEVVQGVKGPHRGRSPHLIRDSPAFLARAAPLGAAVPGPVARRCAAVSDPAVRIYAQVDGAS